MISINLADADILQTVKLKMPNKKLNPNKKIHYQAKAKLQKKERHLSFLCFQHSFKMYVYNPEFVPYRAATIRRVFHFRGNQRRDKDNFEAMTKGTTDGIRDSGLMSDDDNIIWLPTLMLNDIKKGSREYLEYEIYSLS